MNSRTHWETVYRTKDIHEVSWFQAEARRSLDVIDAVCPDLAALFATRSFRHSSPSEGRSEIHFS